MEQATGSIVTGIRAFSANLPLSSLLWPSTALRLFVYYRLSGEYRVSVSKHQIQPEYGE